jgi:hypothetical protein
MVAGPAFAQTPDQLEQARRAFAEGEAAEERGDCATAIERYAAVVSVKETAAVRLRIGRCLERLGRVRDALVAYERARELARADAQALEVATQVATDLRDRIPTVTVEVPRDVAGAVVTIDGEPMPAGAGARQVDPGRHEVIVEAPGRQRFSTSFEVALGRKHVVDVWLPPVGGNEPPPPPPPPDDEASPSPWLPVALYGVGGVAIGVAIPLLITASSDDSDLDGQCFDASGAASEDRDPCLHADGSSFTNAERAAFEDDRSSVNTRQAVGWVLAGVGVASAGVATVLLLTGGDQPSASTGLQVQSVAPVASPTEAGFAVRGAF